MHNFLTMDIRLKMKESNSTFKRRDRWIDLKILIHWGWYFIFFSFFFFPQQAAELSYHKFVLSVVTCKSFLLLYKQSNMLEHASFFSWNLVPVK